MYPSRIWTASFTKKYPVFESFVVPKKSFSPGTEARGGGINPVELFYFVHYKSKYFNNKCPSSFENFFIQFRGENRTKSFILEVPLKKFMEHYPTYCLPKTWNSFNISYKNAESLRIFKDNLKESFLSQYTLVTKKLLSIRNCGFLYTLHTADFT